MAATTHLITVEEFRKLAKDDGGCYHELRQGEIVAVSRPSLPHIRIQKKLINLLNEVVKMRGEVIMEFSFRPVAEYEFRVADVAYISKERWEGTLNDLDFIGVPEIVIEVLSPSNTALEIYDKEQLCLDNGAREFWVVDPKGRQVRVSTPDGRSVTFRAGQSVPLPMFGDATLAVDSLF